MLSNPGTRASMEGALFTNLSTRLKSTMKGAPAATGEVLSGTTLESAPDESVVAARAGCAAYARGGYAAALGHFTDAVDALREAQAAAGGASPSMEELQCRLLVRRAATWTKLSEFSNAVQDADDALALLPNSASAMLLKGRSLLLLQQHALATDCFREGLKHHPCDEELRKGFYEGLKGVRSHWHQYCPAYGRAGLDGSASPRGIESKVSGPACFALSPRALQRADPEARMAATSAELAETVRLTGATLDVDALLGDEARLWRELGSTIPLDVEAERLACMQLVLEYRGRLHRYFTAYCALGWAATRASPRQGVSRLSMAPSAATGSVQAAGGVGLARRGRNVEAIRPLSSQRCMSMRTFQRFAEDCGILTPTFNRDALEEAWRAAQPMAGFSDNAGAHSDQSGAPISAAVEWRQQKLHPQTPAPPCGGWSVIFPKFVEVLIRLTLSRYKPRATNAAADSADGEADAPASVPESALIGMAERARHAFETHLTGGKAEQIARGAKQAKDWASSKELQGILDFYGSGIRKIFEHFCEADTPAHKSMRLVEFLRVWRTLGIADTRRLTLAECAKLYVAVTGFVGCEGSDSMSYQEFREAVVWCCHIKTFDGIVPLRERVENFLTAELFPKTRGKLRDIGALRFA